jgi:chlorite dismutase
MLFSCLGSTVKRATNFVLGRLDRDCRCTGCGNRDQKGNRRGRRHWSGSALHAQGTSRISFYLSTSGLSARATVDKAKLEVLQNWFFTSFFRSRRHTEEFMAAPEQQPSQTPRRQFVNFAFYKVDPAWRRLPEDERAKGKQEFIRAIEDYSGKVLVIPYSTVGIRGDCDLMLWRISYELELFQQMSAKMLASGLGRYITTPYSYLSMTKRSIYVDHHTHEGQESKRLTVVPGKAKYIFVYPFLKTREWFLLTKAARQGMMDEHIEVGHRFPSVKLNTTYSFGLDDQEWVVAFESDKPEDFLDLVMALRETEGSRYTLRDTPIFTCIRGSLKETLDTLGG